MNIFMAVRFCSHSSYWKLIKIPPPHSPSPRLLTWSKYWNSSQSAAQVGWKWVMRFCSLPLLLLLDEPGLSQFVIRSHPPAKSAKFHDKPSHSVGGTTGGENPYERPHLSHDRTRLVAVCEAAQKYHWTIWTKMTDASCQHDIPLYCTFTGSETSNQDANCANVQQRQRRQLQRSVRRAWKP